MSAETKDTNIRTEARPLCPLCSCQGSTLYSGLRDKLFGASGNWSLKKCANNDCGLVWLDPSPHKDDLWKLYLSYYTHTDSSEPVAGLLRRLFRFFCDCYLSSRYEYFAGTRKEKLRLFGLMLYLLPGKRADLDFSVMYLPGKKQGRLLEVGCGSGMMLKNMERLGWICQGTDFDPSGVENARRKGLDVRHGALEDQQYADNTFDAVMISHVIEHVPDPEALLRECHRILKPGGLLSMVTPNSTAFGHIFFRSSWLHLDPPRHLMLHNIRSISALARQAGFQDVSATTTVRDAHGLFWASCSIRKNNCFSMGTQPPQMLMMLFRLLRVAEYFVLKFFPHRGEELAVIGIK